MTAESACPAALAALFTAGEVRQPRDSLGFLLWQVTHAWQRHVDERLAACDLTHLQFVMLISTAWHTHMGAAPSQATLARWLQVHPMQVSQVVKLLLAKKLLIRERMPHDLRAHRLALTADGVARLRIAVPIVQQAHHLFFDAPGGTEEALKMPLLRLFENLGPAAPSPA